LKVHDKVGMIAGVIAGVALIVTHTGSGSRVSWSTCGTASNRARMESAAGWLSPFTLRMLTTRDLTGASLADLEQERDDLERRLDELQASSAAA
jgi:hypothetical protein